MAKIEYDVFENMSDCFPKNGKLVQIEEDCEELKVKDRVSEIFKSFPYLDYIGVTHDNGDVSSIMPI